MPCYSIGLSEIYDETTCNEIENLNIKEKSDLVGTDVSEVISSESSVSLREVSEVDLSKPLSETGKIQILCSCFVLSKSWKVPLSVIGNKYRRIPNNF